MAPPTATATETAEAQASIIKMNTEPEEEMEFDIDSLSRGPNQLKGTDEFIFVLLFDEKSLLTGFVLGIPKFPSFYEHRKHIVIHMAAVFRNWARVGFTEGISGHISVRDPEYDGLIWMNPIGRHFGLLNGSDMICLRISDGGVVGGNRVRCTALPLAIYSQLQIHSHKTDSSLQRTRILHPLRNPQSPLQHPRHLPCTHHRRPRLGCLW